ncbi:hypothetical protein B0H19DRAFT_1078759 [Mycena capillaripes]|nr:hypothetical protein B0H19DRAFT_1078759 [Mycena capillaripes]
MSKGKIVPWVARLKETRSDGAKDPPHPYLLDPMMEIQFRFVRSRCTSSRLLQGNKLQEQEFNRFSVPPPTFWEMGHRFHPPRTLYGFLCPSALAIKVLTKHGVRGVTSNNVLEILPRFVDKALKRQKEGVWPQELHGSVRYEFGLHGGHFVPVLALLDSYRYKGIIPTRALATVAFIPGKLDVLDDPESFPYHYLADDYWPWEPLPPSEMPVAAKTTIDTTSSSGPNKDGSSPTTPLAPTSASHSGQDTKPSQSGVKKPAEYERLRAQLVVDKDGWYSLKEDGV